MAREFECVRDQMAAVLKTGATVVLLGLLLAAGGRSLAPLLMEGPDDRSAADMRATDVAYRYAASYATDADALPEPLMEF
jgi:hypothetical protein